jgi:preprotein translocase subunit YajC
MPTPEGLLVSLDPAAAGGSSLVSSLTLMVAFVAIFYFVMLRPQQKEAKEHAQLLASIQKGDRIVTTGGIHAKVHEVKGDTIAIELSPNVFMTVDREAVKRKIEPVKAEPVKGS